MTRAESLPDGWEQVKLGQVLSDIQPGFASGKHTLTGSGIPHLRPMNVTRGGRIDRDDLRLIPEALADGPRRRLRQGDVLFNNTNSLPLVGKTALFDGHDAPAFSNHMTRLRVKDDIADPAFIARLLHSYWEEGVFQQLANNHVSQASIGRNMLEKLVVALPAVAEQRRIAERLDDINRYRDSVNEHLQVAGANLVRLRQVVLSAACSGQLTKKWRKRRPHSTSDDLPAIALERRRAREKRFVEPQLNPYAGSSDLSDSWKLMPLGLVLEELKYGTSKRSSHGRSGVPVLRIPNVSAGVLDIRDLKYAELTDGEIDGLRLQRGDLLMVRSNGSVQLVGVTAAVTSEGESMAYAGYLIRLRVDQALIQPEFLRLMLAAPQLRQQIEIPARSTSGVHNINKKEIQSLGVPVPSIEEQAEVVRRAARALAITDQVASQVDGLNVQLNRSYRAVLKRAFRGELVLANAQLTP